jgi:hypothetical protein
MLRSAHQLLGSSLKATDGDIGHCQDFLFDDTRWTIRYMVADTGTWLHDRKVLVSPISLGHPDWDNDHFPVDLTREQIENAPDLDEDAPVSRQFEKHWFDYFGYAYYWMGSDLWGSYSHPVTPVPPLELAEPIDTANLSLGDDHLRSLREVRGYHIAAADGEIGHLDDLVIDDDDWSIRYLVVDTRNWLPAHRVILSPHWTQDVDWAERLVKVDLDRDQVRRCPPYDAGVTIQREYEERLHDHYGKDRYW